MCWSWITTRYLDTYISSRQWKWFWMERVTQQRPGNVLVSSKADLWPLFLYSFSPNHSMSLIKRRWISKIDYFVILQQKVTYVNQDQQILFVHFFYFFAKMFWSQWYFPANGFPSRVWLLHLIKRPHGHFYRQVTNSTITMPLRHQTNLNDILEKVFCDRLPDCSPNVSASHSMASSRCLDPCTRLLRSTVKLILITYLLINP